MKKNIKIGIIGGMGPFASSYFLQLLLQKISEENIDTPEIILDSVPIKDFISDQRQIKSGLLVLKDRVKKMNKLGVDMVVMTCNTAHILYHQLSAVSLSPFPSLIDMVVKEVNKNNLTRVGLFATPTTQKFNLYSNKAISTKCKIFLPDAKLGMLIEKHIKKATNSVVLPSDKNQLIEETKKFIKIKNLDGLILGCTELPLIFPKNIFSSTSVIDCQDVLASYIINFLNVKI